jgi:beta-1,2-rhamnosyltransferase WsaF-like protein
VATTWRTAHVARAALRSVDAARFLYVIRDYDPLHLPSGTFAALATESYAMPHVALYSSAMLREYFRRHGIGVHDDERSAVFEEAIGAVAPGAAGSETRKLLFHAGDLFELGVLALSRAAELGAFARGWTLHAVGTERRGRRLDLGGGDWMHLESDADFAQHDVGLALVHAPRPGSVPIEMAAAGMLVVTNTFETKTAAALAAISPNLIGAEPTIEGIAQAINGAVAAADDVEARRRGSAVRWSRDEEESFPDELLDRVIALLGA